MNSNAPRTRVVNLRCEPYDLYIGRRGDRGDGDFGNPYRIGDPVPGWPHPATREQVLACFREYFRARIRADPEYRRRVLGLRGKRLGCFCAPAPCHGDVIAEWIDAGHRCAICNLNLVDAETGFDTCKDCLARRRP